MHRRGASSEPVGVDDGDEGDEEEEEEEVASARIDHPDDASGG